MTLKLHLEHPLLKGSQPTRSSAVTNRTMNWKARVVGDTIHSQGAECQGQRD